MQIKSSDNLFDGLCGDNQSRDEAFMTEMVRIIVSSYILKLKKGELMS